ncbi:hypothetical protein N7528_008395 [Penicillium herquei]|nr:hypothetical protein N7528_008395 [Penicillium herquei]
MMVIKDTCTPESNSDSVMWLDFHRARTFNEGEITKEQVEWIKNEEDIVISLGGHFAFDHAQNKIEKSLKFY